MCHPFQVAGKPHTQDLDAVNWDQKAVVKEKIRQKTRWTTCRERNDLKFFWISVKTLNCSGAEETIRVLLQGVWEAGKYSIHHCTVIRIANHFAAGTFK